MQFPLSSTIDIFQRIKRRVLLFFLRNVYYRICILRARSLFTIRREKRNDRLSTIARKNDLYTKELISLYSEILNWQANEVSSVGINADSCDPKSYSELQRAYAMRASHRGKTGRSRRLQHDMIWETAWALLYAPVSKNFKIADIGAENSCLPSFCAQRGCDAYGLDVFTGGYGQYFRESVLSLCKNNQLILDIHEGQKTVGSVKYLVQNVTNLSMPDDFFDRIYCISTIEHTSDDSQAIKEMSRTLKKGGILALTFPFDQEFSENTLSESEKELFFDANRVYSPQAITARLIKPSGLEPLAVDYTYESRNAHHLPGQTGIFSAALFLRKN